MKALLYSLATGAALSCTALAGSYGKNYTDTPPPAVQMPQGCECFAAGTQGFSLYGAYFTESDLDDSAFGAGASYSLYPDEFYGFEVDATWGFADSTIHTLNASFILRYPIKEFCIAPYALIGAGIHTNGVKEGVWHIGVGLDMRLTQDCLGIFADARYIFAEEIGDHALIRAGMRMNF
jgi:hypothetical protein